MKLTCAIVEDDTVARLMIENLAEKTNQLIVKGSFGSGQEAAAWLSANRVDLLFLDIEMPDLSGFALFKSLPVKPEVIVISGSTEYAVQAFELSVTDYLVKPVKDYARFLAAVNKVIARKKSQGSQPEDQNLFIKIDSLLTKINLDSILWVEAFGDYVRIQTPEKLYTVYSSLKKIEAKLDPAKFVRVHRSYIVNISKITNIDPNNLEINKKIIPISGTYKDDLLNRINIL